jgi:hypothetical protein
MFCSASTPSPDLSRVSGSQPVDQDIGVSDELTCNTRIGFTRDVEHRAVLAGVEVLEQPATIGVGFAAGKRAPSTQRISFRSFNFDDVGTKIDEQLAAVGT